MKRTFKTLAILSRHTWWWSAGLVVFVAIMVSAARLFLPLLDSYRDALELTASSAVGQPVAIGDLKVGWHGLGPRLELHKVQLFDPSGVNALLSIDTAYIDISVPRSIYQRQLEFGDLTLVGVTLSVVRRADGEYAIEGVNLLEQTSASDAGAGVKWLLRQPRLILKDSLVRWRDESSGAHLVFTQANLRIHNKGDRHLLGGDVVLPETMGGAMTVRIDALGDIERPEQLQVNFYLKGAQLHLAQWLVDRPALGVRMVNGTADIELWGLWQQQQLRQLRGDLGLQDFYLARDVDAAAADAVSVKLLPSIAGRFVWQGDGAAWQLDMERLQFGSDQPAARVHVAQRLEGGVRTLEVATDVARLQTLTELALNSALLSPEWQQQLTQLQPRGDLYEGYLKLQLQAEQAPRYFARARVENFGVNPWKNLPGVDGLDFHFNLDQESGVADLASTAAHIDTNGLFRELLPVERAAGRLAWQHSVKGWHLVLRQLDVSNQDLAAQLQGTIDVPVGDTSPRVDLHAQIIRGNGAMTFRYLPVGIMNKETVAWLDRGIVAGQVSDGAMVLQGPLRQFPFVDGSGRFEIGFKVKDAIVDYADGWPRIEQVAADVKFAGNSMTINGRSGKVFTTGIQKVAVTIADFSAHPAHLTLAGETRGTTADLLQFLEQSPLRDHFSQLTNGTVASGSSALGLNLDVPLTEEAPITTRGWVSFDNSALNLKRYSVDLAAINGRLAFTDHTVSAEQLLAEVLGQPAQLTISTAKRPKNNGNFIFEATGESRLPALAERIDLPVFAFLKGQSQWQARLELPRNDAAPTLRVVSQLKGTAVELPAGIGKSAAEVRPLELLAEFDAQATLWRFDYGKTQFSGLFELRHDKVGSHLQRAELRLGQKAVLPATAGFRLAGTMAHFDYEAWRPIIFPDAVGDGPEHNGKKEVGSAAITELDIGFDSALVFGQPLHQVKLQAQHTTNAWRAQIESKELAGKVILPDDWKQPLQMELARLYISTAESGDKKLAAGMPRSPSSESDRAASKPVDPRDLPPLQIKSADTRFGNAALGRMELLATRRLNGMSIDSLNFDSATANIKLQGRWLQGGGAKQQSHVNGTLDIHDLGGLLAGFGYVETVKGGKGSGGVDLKWNGAIIDPTVARLEGMVNFDLEDGRLLEVDPGAGRLFGLLSVQALPRRLRLDFSDLFGKGLAFDYMRGQFDFKDGNAVTDDFVLDGPSAQVELQGRVGLVARDYDQQLKVTPHFTSSLPLAGAVVGGVVVGAAVLLVEKLLKSSIDRVSGVRYHVTGSWDDPVMARQD